MTDQHPLTDEMLEAIHKDYQEAINECDTLICLKIEFDKALRAAYDLAWKNAKDQDEVYIRQSYNQGYNDAKKEINCVLSQTRELEEL